MPQTLPIGAMDFRGARRLAADTSYVDKSGFIGRILRSPFAVMVFCRPRRFGKTLNLTMLREWIEAPLPGPQPAVDPFTGMAIFGDERAMAERGQHTVLYLSLKCCKFATWADNLNALGAEVASAIHRMRPDLAAMAAPQRRQLETLANSAASTGDLGMALRVLTTALTELHSRPVWLLIDEYDAPLQTAWEYGFYEDAVRFFRPFFGNGLKDNPALHKAVMTGILRVPKEGIFSELNNVVVDTVLDREFAGDFGFTEPEVAALVGDDAALMDQLRQWYNGYQIGPHAMYNPWSVANALREPDRPMQAHWMASGGTKHLERVATHARGESAADLESLLQGNAVDMAVVSGVTMPETERAPQMMLNLLLHTGYVTAVATHYVDDLQHATVRVPNREVAASLRGLFDRLVHRHGYADLPSKLVQALLNGDAATAQATLGHLVVTILSYHDLADTTPERVYHLFVLGLLCRLPPGYRALSNREFGEGRPDVVIEPAQNDQPAALLEFKTGDTAELACAEAAAQIVAKNYAAGVRGAPVFAWAVGFAGKQVVVRAVGQG